MSSRNRHVALLAALGLTLTATAVTSTADAFCRSTTCAGDCGRDYEGCKTEGNKLYWESLCVGFSLHKGGSQWIEFSEFERVAKNSFVQWSDRECPDGGSASLAFAQAAAANCHKAEYNIDGANANIILFQDHKWSYTGVDNTLAKTTVTYDTDTGEILDADIEINHAYNAFTTGDEDVDYDLESILTHEIGHYLGLDHTLDLVATMNAGYQQGTTELRSLEDDDIAALCAAYPPGRQGHCDPTPKGGFSKECGAEATVEEEGCSVASPVVEGERKHYGWIALAGLAGLLCATRRRRR